MFKTRLILCSTNKDKIKDFTHVYKWYYKGNKAFELLPISKAIDIPEEQSDSLLINACDKAKYYANQGNSFNTYYVSDDSGFYVNALGGIPGAYVKRWCLETGEKIENKVLRLLKDTDTRECKVSSAVAISDGTSTWSELMIKEGTIPLRYTKGGYKGIFIPFRCDKTLGEMDYKESLNPSVNPRSRAFLTVLSLLG